MYRADVPIIMKYIILAITLIFSRAWIFPACIALVIHYDEQIQNDDLHENTESANGCHTVECQTSAFVLRHLNHSVNPCDDFYEFACGGWIRDNPVPPTMSHVNQFRLAEEKLQSQLQEILEKNNPHNSEPVRAASLYYRSCIDSKRIEHEGLNQLIKFLSEYGGWPITLQKWDKSKFNWLKLSTDSLKRLMLQSLIDISVGFDRRDSNRSVIIIDQASLILPKSSFIPSKTSVHLEAYRQWIASCALYISKHLNESVPIDVIEAKAHNIVEFEIELAKHTAANEMRRNAFRMYNNWTLRGLQDWTDSASSEFKIDWLTMIRDIFAETGISIDYEERVIVKEVDYFFDLATLLQNTPIETLANFLHWGVVRGIGKDMSEQMRIFLSQFDAVYSGIVLSPPRWRSCIDDVVNSLNFAVGYAYVKQHVDEESRIMAKDMVDNIIAAFAHQLKNAEWMDEPTKSSALTKLNSITLFIGYPEWFNNVSALYAYYDGLTVGASYFENVEQVRSFLYKQKLLTLREETNRNEWLTGPVFVNAFNNGYSNSIILPAGILQLPFFDPKRIMAMNYGSIGAVIGHEILHSFDDTGRHTDKFGNLAQWWSENVIKTYEKKTQCFVDQYSKYLVPILEDVNETETASFSVNGIFTQGENIADNSGLRQAYFGYQKYVQDYGEEKFLRGLRQFTPDQLFFISYAVAWCESNTKKSLMEEILNDPHSPHKVRVIGTLSNSPEFANVFKCSKNSPMNPQEKCIIW